MKSLPKDQMYTFFVFEAVKCIMACACMFFSNERTIGLITLFTHTIHASCLIRVSGQKRIHSYRSIKKNVLFFIGEHTSNLKATYRLIYTYEFKLRIFHIALGRQTCFISGYSMADNPVIQYDSTFAHAPHTFQLISPLL